MSKPLSEFSLKILEALNIQKRLNKADIERLYSENDDVKKISSTIYRLEKQSLIEKTNDCYILTEEGQKVIHINKPEIDGVWKLIIFDIPETERYIRNVFRQKIQTLGFKKWQNSIWVSPFVLDQSLENELKLLAKKYFIRLIKTTQINDTSDLELLFPEISKKIDRAKP